MPKVSVYIHDELWAKVRALSPETGASQLIQETIREYVDRRERKPYAVLNADLMAKRQAAAEKAQEKLAKDYRIGYEIGLELTDYLSWDLFDAFARSGWDFDKFYEYVLGAPREHFSTTHGEFDLDEAWQELATRYDIGPIYPDGPILDGAVDALKDIWEGIANAGAREPTPPKSPAPAAAKSMAKEDPDLEGDPLVVIPFREEADDAGGPI